MYIKKLIVKNYKSIKDETFLFNKGINVLVGKNNAGKSNIVLALNEILGDKYNTTSYEDKIFYCNENNEYEKDAPRLYLSNTVSFASLRCAV